jgi:tight adherence protein C
VSAAIQLLILVVLGAVLMAATAAIWVQRSPRRATLSTLKVATATTKSSAPARGTPGIIPPVSETSGANERSSKLEGTVNSVVDAIALLARRLSPPGYLAAVQRRLTLAGKGRTLDANRFLALRLVTLVLIVPAFLLLSFAELPGLYRLLAFFLLASLLGLGPEAGLNRAVAERQDNIRQDLPILVELLMISVEAGLGFDQAMVRSIGSVPGPLGEEFSRFLGEVRMGSDHREALEAIDRRTDVDELRSFLMALVQAETFGTPIGPILRSQAQEARIAQRQQVQEKAQKAPVKMLFPMVFCVLPALFIVIIGPAAIEVYNNIIIKK